MFDGSPDDLRTTEALHISIIATLHDIANGLTIGKYPRGTDSDTDTKETSPRNIPAPSRFSERPQSGVQVGLYIQLVFQNLRLT